MYSSSLVPPRREAASGQPLQTDKNEGSRLRMRGLHPIRNGGGVVNAPTPRKRKPAGPQSARVVKASVSVDVALDARSWRSGKSVRHGSQCIRGRGFKEGSRGNRRCRSAKDLGSHQSRRSTRPANCDKLGRGRSGVTRVGFCRPCRVDRPLAAADAGGAGKPPSASAGSQFQERF